MLSTLTKGKTRVKFAPSGKVRSPEIRFVFGSCSFPHELGIEETFTPTWGIVNNGDPGVGVLLMGPHPVPTWQAITLAEDEYFVLTTWEHPTGAEDIFYTEEPIRLTDLADGTLRDSGLCVGFGWYLGYYVEEEETIYLTDVWGTYTYILPWPSMHLYINSEGAWRDLASGRFIPGTCTFPQPPEAPAPDEAITSRIEFEFGGVGPEWHDGGFCPAGWCHHYRPTFYSTKWNFVGSVNLMVNYGSGWIRLASYENPTPQIFVWSLATTIEELIGTIEKSKLSYIHFGLQFHMLLERRTTLYYVEVSSDAWIVDEFVDLLSYSTFSEVPELPPPELYPYPGFIPELCSVSKTIVAPNEEFTISLTVENRNEIAGDIYLGYLCEGVWHEVLREAIGSLERKPYELSTTAEELTGRVFERDEHISARFIIGYVEPGMPVGEYRPNTVTYEWNTPGITVLVSEIPPIPTPPTPGIGIPWKILVPIAGVGVVLGLVTRGKK